MSTAKKIIRFMADVKDYGSTLINEKTQESIEFVEGDSLEFQVGLSKYGPILDLTDVARMTLSINNMGNGAEVLSQPVSSFDFSTFTDQEWTDGTKQHATISIAPRRADIPPGDYYLNLQIHTTDFVNVLSFARSPIAVKETDIEKYWLRGPTFLNQTFSYSENQSANAVLGTLVVSDNTSGPITITFDNDAANSEDGFLTINSQRQVLITAAGVSSPSSPLEKFEWLKLHT